MILNDCLLNLDLQIKVLECEIDLDQIVTMTPSEFSLSKVTKSEIPSMGINICCAIDFPLTKDDFIDPLWIMSFNIGQKYCGKIAVCTLFDQVLMVIPICIQITTRSVCIYGDIDNKESIMKSINFGKSVETLLTIEFRNWLHQKCRYF